MPPKADPAVPKAGIKWFRKRIPMLKEDWLEVDAAAQARAFTIARVAQLDLIQEVMEKLAAAMKRGDSFDAFKKDVSGQLTRAWGEDRPWHIETIFRNGNQRAYTAGRREEMTKPGIIKQRPYWVAAPLLDTRTTEICNALRPQVVLRAEHAWWNTHWAPLHHNCRTVVYSASPSEAKALGITTRPPSVKAAPGFGHSAPFSWQPDLSLYSPELVKVYRRGQ